MKFLSGDSIRYSLYKVFPLSKNESQRFMNKLYTSLIYIKVQKYQVIRLMKVGYSVLKFLTIKLKNESSYVTFAETP